MVKKRTSKNKVEEPPKKKSILSIFSILVGILVIIILTIWGAITYSVRAKEILNGKNYTSNNNIIEKFQNTALSKLPTAK